MERTRPTAVLTTMRPAQAMRIFVSTLALAAVFALPASAGNNPFGHGVPHVYQSTRDDDASDEWTRVLPMGSSTLILYVSAGATPSATGTPCLPGVSEGSEGGDGEELCIFHAQLLITGGHFTSFNPTPLLGIVSSATTSLGIGSTPIAGVYTSPFPTLIQFNYLDAVSPLAAGPLPAVGAHRLGELGVEVTSGTAVVSVTGIDSIRAINERQLSGSDPMPAAILAVPEPDFWLLLAAGLFGLAVLQRIRLAGGG